MNQLDLFSDSTILLETAKVANVNIFKAPTCTVRVEPAGIEVPLKPITHPITTLTDWQGKLAMPVTVLAMIAKQLSDNAKHPCRMCHYGGGNTCVMKGRMSRCLPYLAHNVALELQYGSMDNTEGATPLGYAGEYGFCN